MGKRVAREIEDRVRDDGDTWKGWDQEPYIWDSDEIAGAAKYVKSERAKVYVARALRAHVGDLIATWSPGGLDHDLPGEIDQDQVRWDRSKIQRWTRLADQLEGKGPTKIEMPDRLKRRYETATKQRASRRHGNRQKYVSRDNLVPKLHVELDVMHQLTLHMNVNAITRAVGTRLALMVRKSLRKGHEYHGPPGEPGRDGKPFIESGRMLKDLRFVKETQTVGPTHIRKRSDLMNREKVLPDFKTGGVRRIRGNRRVQTSYAIMAVNIAKGIFLDPLGSTRPQTQRDINQWTRESLDELVRQGKGVTLEAALRRTLLMGTRRLPKKK